MTPGGDDLYQATIPADAVIPSQLYYYIEAMDSLGLATLSPVGAPDRGVYVLDIQ